MTIQKRIKRIVSLTVNDFHNHSYSTNQSDEELISWVVDTLLKDKLIEDCSTIEISLKVLEMLKSLDIVDLEFIHTLLFKDENSNDATVTLSVIFNGVKL